MGLTTLLALAGCAGDSERVAVRRDLDRVNSQLIQLQVDQRLAQARPSEVVQQELRPYRQNIADLKAGLEELKQQVSVLAEKLDESGYQLSQRLNTLEAKLATGASGTAPAPLLSPPLEPPPSPQPSGALGQPPAPPLAPAPVASAASKRLYDAALTDYQRGKFDLASQGFRAYLTQAPRGDVADTAQYYLAESLYSGKNYRNAVAEFERLVRDFPQSPRAPSALLKTGYAYYEMKDSIQGRRALRTLIEKYPFSKEAKLAEERLRLEDRTGTGRTTTPPPPPRPVR
ncbi:MAG: tol-pal system protein YbgF [Nitrospinae bacterium]|nr:tol-pal system protein YbgF [Nitrospinota bacterium]